MQKQANLQDIFLGRARKARTPVTVFLVNGFQLRGKQQMIYKHAISTVVPIKPIELQEEA